MGREHYQILQQKQEDTASFQNLDQKILEVNELGRREDIKLNSVALVRERTIPTERPPPVGEVSANFCGQRGVMWSAQRVPTAVNLCFLDLEPLLFFYSSSSSVDLTRLSRPRYRPTTTHKNLVAPGIEPETSVSVARNSDHQTTEAVGREDMVTQKLVNL